MIPAPEPARAAVPTPSRWKTYGATYLLMGAAILGVDLVTGPYLMFPIFFVIPVAMAAWYCGLSMAITLAVILPVGRLVIAVYIDHPMPTAYALINAAIRVAVLSFIAVLTERTARQTRELARELKLLEGILPICMFCKRIRDEKSDWQQLEAYITQHSEADFSHGLCPECARKNYGEFFASESQSAQSVS